MASKPKTSKVAAKPKTVNPSLNMIEFSPGKIADALLATGGRKIGKMFMVPYEGLTVVPGFNLRVRTPVYEAGIEELTQSILQEGYYDSKPLTGFAVVIDGEDKIAITDGHRRYEAFGKAIEAGLDQTEMPVVLKTPVTSDLDVAVALQKENSAVSLTMLERAVLARRLLKVAGEDEESVAGRLNVSIRHINDLKVLITAPKAVRDLVRDGIVSGSEAVLQLRKDPTGAKLIEAAEKAAERAAEKAALGKGGAKESKVTRQTLEDDGTTRVKMQTIRNNFEAKAGATFLYEDAVPFLPIIADETWFKKARKQTERTALIDISVEVKIRRPKTDEEVEAETTAATEKAAAKANGTTNGKGKGGRPHRGVDPEDSGGGLDPDFDDAPDLQKLGVADPADGL